MSVFFYDIIFVTIIGLHLDNWIILVMIKCLVFVELIMNLAARLIGGNLYNGVRVQRHETKILLFV